MKKMNLNPWSDMDRDTADSVSFGMMIWGLIFFTLSWILPTFNGEEPHLDLAILAGIIIGNSLVDLYSSHIERTEIRPREEKLYELYERMEDEEE